MVKLYLPLCLVLACMSPVFTQLSFTPNTDNEHVDLLSTGFTFSNQSTLLSNQDFSSILIVGIADMNGDKLDDIIRLEGGRDLTIEYQTTNEHFENYTFGLISDNFELTLAIADVDHNGFNDIMVGGQYDGVKLLLANQDGTDYTESVLPESDILVQGSNFVDINEDGLTDIFICDDNAESKIWENTGDGNFIIANDWIDMSTTPASDNSGNYASAWTDIDNDGDLDLYISKCRSGVESPLDPRRINQLFINDGQGGFLEMAAEYGLKIGAQSWTSDFQDIDNDGDLDCFVVNHYEACQLFENDGTGHFTEITLSSGLDLLDNPLQGILRDFNNDGFVDLLTAGNNGYRFYENNGDQTFEEVEEVFGDYEMGTFAIGDLNHDGFLDVYSGSPTMDDVLWVNEKNSHHFFSVHLTSNLSNPNAIGARVELYGDWGIQIREVRAGESYGISNSFTQHFGLGTFDEIDSLRILWPSGNVEIFNHPQADQVLHIVEGDCAYPDCFIKGGGDLVVCTGDTLRLTGPVGSTYEWSNGMTGRDAMILEAGTYQVTTTNAYGCTSVSNEVTIIQDPDVAPMINVLGDLRFCRGRSVILQSPIAPGYTWSSGQHLRAIMVTESGDYYVTTEGRCVNLSSDTVRVEVIEEPADPIVQHDTIAEVPAIGNLTATGDNLFWYDAPIGGTLLWEGSMFETPMINESTTFYVEDVRTVGEVTCPSDRVEALVIVDSTNAVIALPADGTYDIFPNPSSDFILIKNRKAKDEQAIVRMFNLSGQLVYQSERSTLYSDLRIETRPFGSGMYTITIETDEQVYYKKIVIDIIVR